MLNKLIGSLFLAMTTVALVYINYHAIKDSVPFMRRQYDKIGGLFNRVTESKAVATVTSAGGRVVHMFKRSETA